MNRDNNKVANGFMVVARALTSENKYEVRRLQNDIIIYLFRDSNLVACPRLQDRNSMERIECRRECRSKHSLLSKRIVNSTFKGKFNDEDCHLYEKYLTQKLTTL